jgi:hypothetical protein
MDVRMHSSDTRRLLDTIGGYGGIGSVVKTNSWHSSKISGFIENITVELDDGNSFYMGVNANWEQRSEYAVTVRLEFNPAKVANHVVFKKLHHDIVFNAKYIDFKRYDLAVDVPVSRRDIWIKKDKRTYKCYKNSELDKTEYLGQRAKHGQVKLYNKQMEAKLNYPLSRVEITVDYEKCTFEDLLLIWPEVTYLETEQLNIEMMELGDTDRVLLLACLEHREYLTMLGRKKAKKIECIMDRYTQRLEPDIKLYKKILSQIRAFGKSYYNGGIEEYLIMKGFGW